MDMQEKRLFPMREGEDPSLPWPDCGMNDVPAQPGPGPVELPTPEVAPENGMMPGGSGNNWNSGQNGSMMPGGSGNNWNSGQNGSMMPGGSGNNWNSGQNGSMSPGGGTQLPSDSIDPRLLSLAMAFVPRQSWETPYDFDVALRRGTIFPSLDKPFLGEEALPR